MKKSLAMLVAAMLCACCLGLAACGGSSSSSADSGSASASASASAASASDAASSASASASGASSAAADGVSPELKEAGDKLAALADSQTALVDKAKAAGSYDAVEAEWEELSKQVSEVTSALQPWAQKLSEGALSDADKAYYMRVVGSAASKSASAGLDMLELIK